MNCSGATENFHRHILLHQPFYSWIIKLIYRKKIQQIWDSKCTKINHRLSKKRNFDRDNNNNKDGIDIDVVCQLSGCVSIVDRYCVLSIRVKFVMCYVMGWFSAGFFEFEFFFFGEFDRNLREKERIWERFLESFYERFLKKIGSFGVFLREFKKNERVLR